MSGILCAASSKETKGLQRKSFLASRVPGALQSVASPKREKGCFPIFMQRRQPLGKRRYHE